MPDLPVPEQTQIDRQAVLQQLERMLAHPLFKHSKRYSTLLRFVVEHAVEGNTERIKERTLGVEVFGRPPDYDTNQDPAVRVTAGEIRKRIAMYYHLEEHNHEVRIELPPRSYVPEFGVAPPVAHSKEAQPQDLSPSLWMGLYLRHRTAVVVALLTLLLAVPATFAFLHFDQGSALDRFWGPVLASDRPALICVGQRQFVASTPSEVRPLMPGLPEVPAGPDEPKAGTPIGIFQLYYLGSQNVGLPDAVTVGRLCGLLGSKGKRFSIRGESASTFDDVRSGPVILIGAYNNDWTLRLTGPLRYRFERDGDTFWLRDNEAPNDRRLTLSYSASHLAIQEDYAVISRVIDSGTDRAVLAVGGITGYGTTAASEFLTNPAYLDKLTSHAKGDWTRKNLQIVLVTQVIRGVSGPPRIVTVHSW